MIETGDPVLTMLEAQDRERSRASFLRYYMRMTGFQPPPHVVLMARLLQSMEEDRVDRAMVFLPPRHAKTLLCSKLFPSWIIGRHPRTKIMTIAHTADYAKEIGREIRQYMWSPEYPFNAALADDATAKDRWRTTEGGELNAFGAGAGNQHGRPAEWLLMDDIVKGREVAMSDHQRNLIWANYLTDMRSRLQGRRKQLMVFTRWHMDDPAGRILPDDYDGRTGWYKDRNTGEMWYVLSLPAVCEAEGDPLGRQIGDWLWPEQFGERELGPERARGGWMWSALYQQRPSPEEGLMFRAEHIERRYDPARIDPLALTVYGSSDYAVTAEAGAPDPDYTVHLVWGVDEDANMYLLDGWRGRTESDAWIAHFIRLVRQHKPLMWFEEGGQIMRSLGPFLRSVMERERVYCARTQLTSTQSKEARAQALLGMASMGKLVLPARATCPPHLRALLDAFEAEILQFPGGRHDDIVDAATLFARGLDKVLFGRSDRPAKSAPHAATLDDLWSRHEAAESARRRARRAWE